VSLEPRRVRVSSVDHLPETPVSAESTSKAAERTHLDGEGFSNEFVPLPAAEPFEVWYIPSSGMLELDERICKLSKGRGELREASGRTRKWGGEGERRTSQVVKEASRVS